MRAVGWLVPVMLVSLHPHALHAQTQRTTEPASATPMQSAEQRAQKISVSVEKATLETTLRAVAQKANMRLSFSRSEVDLSRIVTAKYTNATVSDILNDLTRGTDITARVASDGRTIIVGRRVPLKPDTTTASGATGIISGRVVDSITGLGLQGVTLSIRGTRLNVTSSLNGEYTFTNVPVGDWQVSLKIFGYKGSTRAVTVVEGKRSVVHIPMVSIPTSLSGVVTTATGVQRKLDIGNDITRINADSVLREMPVGSFTELIATRVPGLVASPTSGAPGAPSRIRIRGLSSINASNDPIIIVDGIRMYSAQGSQGKDVSGAEIGNRSSNMTRATLVKSPLDMIDPNSIETVEVLKGPSAVALYGTNAANGVIVITTKQGRPGPAQWSLNGSWGSETMPGTWPTNYYQWGHYAGTPSQVQCTLAMSVALTNPCIPDSLEAYQILNDPYTTIFGRGTRQMLRADVRGGTRGLTYAFAVASSNHIGLMKIPDADIDAITEVGDRVSGWQRRPQGNQNQSGSVRIEAEVNPRLRVSFSTLLNRDFTRTTNFDRAVSFAQQLTPAGVPKGGVNAAPNTGSGLLLTLGDFRARTTTQQLRATNALRVSARPVWDITTTLNAGFDLTNRRDISKLGRGECFGKLGGSLCVSGPNAVGFFNTGQGQSLVTSLNTLVSAPISLTRSVTVRTSVGADYERNRAEDLLRNASDIPKGATSGNGAATITTSERTIDLITVGTYFETVVLVANRLSVGSALRRDIGSGLGAQKPASFPKFSVSYLVSDEPAFRNIPFLGDLSALRLRLAYGQSGVQPTMTARLRTYSERNIAFDGVALPILSVGSVGNADLRPERGNELEAGFDADLLNNRINLSLTVYKKRTADMLITQTLPPSLGLAVLSSGAYTTPNWQSNVGNVNNTGTEVTLGLTPIQSASASWTTNIGMSWNRNVLTRLARGNSSGGAATVGGGGALSSGSIATRFVEGYPLFSTWTRPIEGYADMDGNGIITGGEVQLGDSMVYLGAPYPNYTASLHNTITLFGRFNIGATFRYENGLTQTNVLSTSGSSMILTRPFNDPATPLATQAYMSAALLQGSFAQGSGIGYVQSVSTLRLSALSFGYSVPPQLTRSILGSRQLRLSLQGTNLALWSEYRGKDPNVNSGMNELARDLGTLPTPRYWQLALGIN